MLFIHPTPSDTDIIILKLQKSRLLQFLKGLQMFEDFDSQVFYVIT